MRKPASVLLWILAVLALSVTTVAKPTPQEQTTQAAGHDDNGQNKQPNPGIVIPAEAKKDVPLQTPTAKEGDKRITEDQSKTDWWARISNAIMAFGTLALAVIGAIAACIAIRTLRSIEAQTTHAGIAADAAKSSVDAVIAENRPWLLIPPNNGVQPPFLEPIERNAERFSHCIFRLKNYGKTPGKITAWNAQLQMGDSPGQPPNPLIYTDIRGATVNPQIIPQGQTIFPEAQLSPGGIIREEELDAVLTRHWKFLWLCGFVKYTDTFDKISTVEYETVFCLLYETRTNSPQPFWRAAGPDEYNKAN